MLDEIEFAEVADLHRQGLWATKGFRQRWGVPLEHATLAQRSVPMRSKYQQLTGLKEQNENAILHHRISLYGAPCVKCGSPCEPQRQSAGYGLCPWDWASQVCRLLALLRSSAAAQMAKR